MNEHHPSAQDILMLRRFAQRLLKIANDATEVPFLGSHDDHYGFMTACLLNAQVEHIQSVCVLTDAKLDRDAGLVSRTMLEAYAMLRWAALEPQEERARLWRTFADVVDWRTLQNDDHKGAAVDPRIREQTMAGIKTHGEFLYKTKTKRRIAKHPGRPVQVPIDPYLKKWTHAPVEKMIEEGADAGFHQLYDQASDWAHSNVKGLSRGVSVTGRTVQYTQHDPAMAQGALAVACQTLFGTLGSFFAHFGRELPADFQQFEKDFLKMMNQCSGDAPI